MKEWIKRDIQEISNCYLKSSKIPEQILKELIQMDLEDESVK